jgi:predicted NBD/HSP70 family sugar kinase
MRIPDQAFNRLSVLKKLRAAEPVSRTELARLSGLTGGTITAIVRDLVERGLILEERRPTPHRGRPRLDLRINPEGAFVAGATMTDDARVLAEIANLKGESIHSHAVPLTQTVQPECLAEQFAAVIDQAIAQSPIARERIAQVGIGLPAMVDSRAGEIRFLETFTDLPFAFADAVERRLGIATRIDNNINLLARSEHWFGDGGVDDFTLVLLDLGLGAARYQAGQLVIGSHGAEAELGHTKIVPEGGRPCHCGGEGCLQTYASMSAIVYQASERAGRAPPPVFKLKRAFGELARAAKAGDAAIMALFDRAGRLLGRAIANHINMQDPRRIVLVAQSREFTELVSDAFFDALERDTLPLFRDRGRVTFKQLQETGFARGAAALVLEQLYLA